MSAFTLLEITILASEGRLSFTAGLDEFFAELQANPVFRVLPLTYEIAAEVAVLASLREPADRAITATARVHRLRLVTSDRRIIESNLVAVVE
jgi:PIN domain nuclease of toxin-antitoxin system